LDKEHRETQILALTKSQAGLGQNGGKRQNVWCGEAESSKIVYEGTPFYNYLFLLINLLATHLKSYFPDCPQCCVAQVSPCLFKENQLKSNLILRAVASGLSVPFPDALPRGAMMDFKTLLLKHQALLAENQALKEENLALKARLGLAEPPETRPTEERVQQDASPSEPSFPLKAGANPTEKIRLFMSLFKGRDDLYAKRWESKEGRAGYAPVCLNEWKPGVCGKPEVKCASCAHRLYATLDEKVIEAHLRGKLVAGVYPLRQDEKCHFLAIDFDKDGWQEDVATLKDVCTAFDVPAAIERSRSGHGAHAWFFFANPVPTSLARKFGSCHQALRAGGKPRQARSQTHQGRFPGSP
jgi:hypothetical protein